MAATTAPLFRTSSFIFLLAAFASMPCRGGWAQEIAIVEGVESQPLVASTKRLVEALEFLGAPLSDDDREKLRRIIGAASPDTATLIQGVLDPYCVATVHVNPESRVKAKEGPTKKELVQQGWRTFLIKVHNEGGVTAPLGVDSPNALPLFKVSTNKAEPEVAITKGEVLNRFLDIALYSKPPLKEGLSGLAVEYRIVQLYSRDVGKREVKLAFNVGQGSQDLGFRNEVSILFNCARAVEVVLDVLDHDDKPTTGSFEIRDRFGRVYPAPGRRLAPDLFFHNQVYRHSGESVHLPAGAYTFTYGRGPEYLTKTRSVEVPDVVSHGETFRLERWISAAAEGWWSGDHHIHAAGCAHYESPSEGVTPKDMMRHILGEDLNVGCVLTWGPCWYYQKQFFEGKVSALSTDTNLMRYDIEVSGFPSSHAGHLAILRLAEDDYKGVKRIEDWPSWDLPILRWAKEQGAVTGFSHSGWGLKVPGDELPNYNMAPFDSIGANEYIVDVVHDVVDFISAVDTPAVWELNIWYHTLNCGFRCRISGETDFPCIYGEKVGLGRVYVKVNQSGKSPLDYDTWVHGLRDGRSYVGDGKSHLLDFAVNQVGVGELGAGGTTSELRLDARGTVKVKARVAAYLPLDPNVAIKERPLDQKPYWHVERSRIGRSRVVPLELIVNGVAVQRQELVADGSIRNVEFEVPVERSSWIALRVFPSSHTNPVFVVVDGKPIRASRRSADWCLRAVEVCWEQKRERIRESERSEARKAFDVARDAYKKILAECTVD